MKTGFITHPSYFHHETGRGHPESPRRLSILEEKILKGEGEKYEALRNRLEVIAPSQSPGLYRWINEVHRTNYTQTLKTSVPDRDLIYLDADTPFSPGSLYAAELAVSGLLRAIDEVMTGKLANAFCAIRPPGHHAEADRAMGFCIFNNVAIGAKYIQQQYPLKKVLIVDWDVHHGNGTQHIFYEDPGVFYFSTHQFPFYPGTGAEEERGSGVGEGLTRNCPLEAGAGDREILPLLEQDFRKVVENFQPDFILISAGFDAHRDDPLASLEVTDNGFEEMTKIVRSLSETHCGGRLVSCLEGGYNLEALARSVERHLEGLSE